MYSCLPRCAPPVLLNRAPSGCSTGIVQADGTGVGLADRTEVVKIFTFLELEPRLNIKYGFNWAGKNMHFSKVSVCVG